MRLASFRIALLGFVSTGPTVKVSAALHTLLGTPPPTSPKDCTMKAYDSKRVWFFSPPTSSHNRILTLVWRPICKGNQTICNQAAVSGNSGKPHQSGFLHTHTHTENQRQTNCEVDIFTPCELRLTVRPGSDGGGEGDPQLKWV